MKITVTLKTGAKIEDVKELSPGHFRASVKARPIKGAANEALAKLLAKHFQVTQSQVQITYGSHSKTKIVSIK